MQHSSELLTAASAPTNPHATSPRALPHTASDPTGTKDFSHAGWSSSPHLNASHAQQPISMGTPTTVKLRLPKLLKRLLRSTAEHWEQVVYRLPAHWHDRPMQNLLITGGQRQLGYSTLALALAWAHAKYSNQPTLLVEADLAHPFLAQQLQLQPSVGLERVLQERLPVESAMFQASKLPLTLLVLDRAVIDPGLPLFAQRLRDLLQHCRQRYSRILLDAGSLFAGTSAVHGLLADPSRAAIDGALLVRFVHHLEEPLYLQARRILHDCKVPVLGILERL